MKSLTRTAAAAVAAAGLALASAGMAHASGPTDTTGQFYGDAITTLQSEGYTVVVAGRTGDQVGLSDCIVAHQQVFLVKKGMDDRGREVHVSLRCYKAEAAALKAAQQKASGQASS